MTDTWDDSDDEWDVDDADIDARLNKLKGGDTPVFANEEDLAIKEQEASSKAQLQDLKKKGTALAAKKKAEQERKEELEVARKAMELEAEAEAKMTEDELRAYKQRQIEAADNALTDDLFGGVDEVQKSSGASEDKIVLRDAKDHLKHARKTARAIKDHGKVHLATSFLKEVIQECRDVLDDAAITDIIKTCNVIKNEKVQAAKRKVKGQAQKSKKVDKVKAKNLQNDAFGDSNKYDRYDETGEDYEESFF